MSQPLLLETLQPSDWSVFFDAPTLTRARSYARNGRVRELGVGVDQPGATELHGRISGSGRRVYTCNVSMGYDDEGMRLVSRCTCPVGLYCKHAAALLIVAGALKRRSAVDDDDALAAPSAPSAATQRTQQSRAKAQARAEWEHWLETLQPAATQQHQAPDERRLGVLLRANDERPLPNLLALPAWLRPAKSKSRHDWVDPQPLRLHSEHGVVPMPAGGWPAGVAAALVTLVQQQSERVNNQVWAPLRARYQEQALEQLLDQFPVWFERGSAPLQRGPALPLELYWREAADGNQRLAARADANVDTLLLRGARLWYVQPGEGRYGHVDGDPRLIQQLPSAPRLAPEHVASVRGQLSHTALPSTLPAPINRGPPETLRVTPTPVLHLRPVALSVWHGPKHDIGVGRLTFDYAGVSLPPTPRHHPRTNQRMVHGERLLDIQRDAAAESNALDQLHSLHAIAIASTGYEFNLRAHDFGYDEFALRPNTRKPPLAPEAWKPSIDALSAAGFRIDYANDFPHDELVNIDAWHAELEPSGNAWFDVSLGIDVDGQRVDLLPILRRLLDDPKFPRVAPKRERKNASYRVRIDAERSVEMPLARLRALIEPLLEWLEGDEKLRLHRSQASALHALADDAGLTWQGGDALRAHLDALANAKRSAKAPRGFKATLRPYQCEGLAWLDFLGSAGLGGILADDMGLGKTVQVLAHIVGARQRKQLDGPALVVAPTSLVGNWRDEAKRFAPRLKVLVIHGPDRADRFDDIAKHHLVITTYPLLARDREQLLARQFSLLVLDEAQAIKNPRSQVAHVVREIPAARRLAMTGTPLENHLGELWAQFDAVEPGLLGSLKQFTKLYRTPIEKHADADRQQRLNHRIGPLLLRRRKEDVLTDLPAKNDIVRTLELEGDQRSLYETLRLAQHERVREAIRKRGMAQAGIIVLDALLKLRQACCDPRLVKLASAKKVKSSAKLDALLALVDGLVSEGRRILLFSQFTEMLGLIEAALDKRGIAYQTLTGQTPGSKRAALVKRFQAGDTPLFLISLKAGGVGLNLTAADTVIHYDPWWNPAVEAQATDRAHRIGQDKPVFVYRLICAGTVEEKIQAMQARKAELARAVLEGGASQRLRFDEADLAALFAPL